MIFSAYITPHSPILIPNIGKKNISILKRSVDALFEIKKNIEKEKIDTIIVFSPYNSRLNTDIEINSHFQNDINFEEFGDYFSKINLAGDLNLAYKIKEEVEEEIRVSLFAQNKPEHTSAIPLYLLLSEENQKINSFKGKIIIINSCLVKNLEHHYNFGKKIANLLERENKKILLIASAELSHRLTQRSLAGFHQKAEYFDNKIIESLKKNQDGVNDLININEKNRQEVKECGLQAISMMLGAINHKNYEAKTMSYQKDLGIGYLTMNMNLK